MLNRNPYKRLGSGKKDSDEIKEHKFFESINWQDALLRKLKVPKPYIKKILKQEFPNEKVYGRGAFDEALKNQNRLNDWSFVQK